MTNNIETAVISGGGTSTGDVHNFVTDSDDADSVLVVTGVAAGNESTNPILRGYSYG